MYSLKIFLNWLRLNHLLLFGINFFLCLVFLCSSRWRQYLSHTALSDFMNYWHLMRFNLFLNHKLLIKSLETMESIFRLSFTTKLLLLKPFSTSACPWLKVTISTKDVNISGYLISSFTFWKKSSVWDSPHLNSFALSWINCISLSIKLQYWMHALSALLKVKRFKLKFLWNNNLAICFKYLPLPGWIFLDWIWRSF